MMSKEVNDYCYKQEFLDADATQQQILIMAHFGRAIFYSQFLEQQCVNMLAINEYSNSESVSHEEYEVIWNKYDFSKKTLGAMIIEMQKAFSISEYLIGELKEVVQYRNFLTHNYFRFNDVLFSSEDGNLRMIKDFYDFTVRVKKLDVLLNTYLSDYEKNHGVTEDKLSNLIKQRIDEWKDKDIDDNFDTFRKNN